jgi:hypothetical protein
VPATAWEDRQLPDPKETVERLFLFYSCFLIEFLILSSEVFMRLVCILNKKGDTAHLPYRFVFKCLK